MFFRVPKLVTGSRDNDGVLTKSTVPRLIHQHGLEVSVGIVMGKGSHMANKLNTTEVLEIIKIILEHPRVRDIEVSVEDEDEFYWDIPLDDAFNMDQKPELVIGKISDDLDFLRPLLREPEYSVPLRLMHAAPILLLLARKVKGF
ncbi:MAG: hypothetical protein JO188_04335 [Hyphomicrobiales bacterium]|nr:hypothetical protein [Hyphomicrobiales bacterium]